MRRTAPIDRTITLLVGLALVAGAAAVVAWREDILISDPTLDLSWLSERFDEVWWPWTVGIAGGLLVLFGLALAIAHLPRRAVSVVRASGSHDEAGLVDSEVLVSTVRDRILEIDGVRSARGRIRRERRQLVMSFVVTVDPAVSLRQTVSDLDQAALMGAQIARRDDLAYRIDLRVARKEHHAH